MKTQNYHISFIFVFFVFLLLSNLLLTTSARQLEKEVKTNGIIAHADDGSFTDLNDLSKLMGSEECDEKDEECLKRRMIAEAHLDYIYTQHHKP